MLEGIGECAVDVEQTKHGDNKRGDASITKAGKDVLNFLWREKLQVEIHVVEHAAGERQRRFDQHELVNKQSPREQKARPGLRGDRTDAHL